MKGKSMYLLIIGVLFIIGCGGSGGSDGSGSDTLFYTAAREVGPTIESSSSQSISAGGQVTVLENIAASVVLNDIYNIIQDYEYPSDEGKIDMHNIYKVIHTASQYYNYAATACRTISETAVASPFDLGITDTYTCAGNDGTMADATANGFAIKDANGIRYSLLTFKWAGPEYGVLQGSYNQGTGDLNLRMVELVDHGSSNFYIRTHLAGNATTHAFTISMISGSIIDTANYVSIVGKGISKGAGNYFLFKVKTAALNGNYFCIPATATEQTLETMGTENPNGSDTVSADCAAYQTDVDAMTFLTTADVPMSLAAFTNSSILVSY